MCVWGGGGGGRGWGAEDEMKEGASSHTYVCIPLLGT